MRTCPYCGQQALSVLRKATLGPLRSTPCQSCGKRISVSWRSMWALVPFILGMAAVAFFEASPLSIVILIVGIIAMFFIHEYAFALVCRDA